MLNLADIKFLQWIQNSASRDYYVWRESQKREIPQSELDFLAWITAPGSVQWFIRQHDISLSNNKIEIRLSGQAGGAICWLSTKGGENLVNTHDYGRYIQQSYYAGQDKDRRDEGQHPGWSPWPWNPIQAGDVYGSTGKLLSAEADGSALIVRSTPILWDMDERYPQAVMETRIGLNGNEVDVQCRMEIDEDAGAWTPKPRHQEMPAIYLISRLNRILTEIDGQGVEITRKHDQERPHSPWNYWPSTPYPGKIGNWTAGVDENGFGVKVVSPDVTMFIGGKHRAYVDNGTSTDPATTYFAPLRTLEIKPQDEIKYSYKLVVGNLNL